MKLKILQIFIAILFISVIFSMQTMAADTVPEDPFSQDVVDENVGNQVLEWGENGTGQTITNDGKTNSYELESTPSFFDALFTILGWIIAIVPFVANFIISLIAGEDTFSIEKLLLGEYELFHINVFNVDGLTGEYAELVQSLSQTVSTWYIALRNLAMVMSAVVLVYVGIRMAFSSVADDKAKYKIMLKNWFISFALLFLLQYIMILLFEAAELLINAINQAIILDPNADVSMEETILNDSFANIAAATGINKLLYIIIYFMMVYYQLKFFLIYIVRVFKVDFLIMIAPLICVTYPIDTMGDNKAQAFNNWIKEMIGEIFLQPIHLCIYLVFIYSAGEIAIEAPLIAIMFFAALSNGEKIIRRAFKVEGKGLKDIKFKPPKG